MNTFRGGKNKNLSSTAQPLYSTLSEAGLEVYTKEFLWQHYSIEHIPGLKLATHSV